MIVRIVVNILGICVMKEKKDISINKIFGYGCGSFTKDLASGVVQSFLLIFYTDIFGIPAAAVSVIFLLAKIWDAINDPIMGSLVDRSRITKWGKYRPYIIFGAIPFCIISFMLFLAPDWSVSGKIAYAAVTYTLWGMAFTVYDVPFWSMIPSLTKDKNTENKLISMNRTVTMIAMLISMGITDIAVKALGGGTSPEAQKSGYMLFMAIIAVVSFLFSLICFLSTKERYTPAINVTETHLFSAFRRILCKPLIIILLTMVFCSMGMTLPSVAGTYYMIYYIGNPLLISVYMICSVSLSIIGTILAPYLMKTISAKKLTAIGFAIELVLSIIVFLLGHGNIVILLCIFTIIGATIGLRMVTITSMLVETIQFIEIKKGIRADGVCFSMNSFATKVGQAIAGFSVSTILAISGYVANNTQTAFAEAGILMIRSLFPAFIALIGFVCVLFWNIKTTK